MPKFTNHKAKSPEPTYSFAHQGPQSYSTYNATQQQSERHFSQRHRQTWSAGNTSSIDSQPDSSTSITASQTASLGHSASSPTSETVYQSWVDQSLNSSRSQPWEYLAGISHDLDHRELHHQHRREICDQLKQAEAVLQSNIHYPHGSFQPNQETARSDQSRTRPHGHDHDLLGIGAWASDGNDAAKGKAKAIDKDKGGHGRS